MCTHPIGLMAPRRMTSIEYDLVGHRCLWIDIFEMTTDGFFFIAPVDELAAQEVHR